MFAAAQSKERIDYLVGQCEVPIGVSTLSATLEKVAHARAIPVRGGNGLDQLPHSAEFNDEDDEGAAS